MRAERPALALVLALFAFGPSVADEPVASGLAGSEWGPERLGEAAVPPEVEAFVRFEADGRLVGDGGCNRFTGTYVIEGERLAIGSVAATHMACPPPRMATERALFDVFEAVEVFGREGALLVLFDGDGASIARLVQRDWD